MQEIRFHGRGGQGTVVASMLLAKAYFKSGYSVQSFPAFGVERRGAPVEAFLRIDRKKIRIRCNVTRPDHILVQDIQLLKSVDVIHGLKPGGWILINTKDGGVLRRRFSGFRVAAVDATHIAVAHQLGSRTHPFINTAMIGALAGILEAPSLESISAAIREDIEVKSEDNVKAAIAAYETVQRFDTIEQA